MEPMQLKLDGARIYEAFRKASDVDNISHTSTIRYLQFRKERFQLWARSLGLFQQGHASLDYRVRDVLVLKQPMSSILQMLLENLGELNSIVLGHRPPFEEQLHKSKKKEDNDANDEDKDKDSEYSGSELSSPRSSDTQSESGNSFGEAQYRLQLITEAIDSLYCLATKVRNPKNRPQRSLAQMCKHIPSQNRAGYIREHENLETMIVAYEDVQSQYCMEDSWLIHRAGVANARRKLQFMYWKQHTRRLGDPTLELHENLTIGQKNKKQGIKRQASVSGKNTDQSIIRPETSIPQQSLATSATHMPPGFLKPEDATSVISRQSRVSTVFSPKGDKISWPSPPSVARGSKFFFCPYCFLLCPDNYLDPDSWRNHLIHDLQPYHCTYESCQDPNRLYSSRQEWIDHESQHTRVWHCQQHANEFETQLEYVDHLQQDHEGITPEYFSTELLSSAVGPSTKLQRGCPFCPTGLDSLIEMQRHLAFHMERLALLALPREEGELDTDRGSSPSYESHEAQQRGRKGSVHQDFDDTEHFTINEETDDDDNSSYQHYGPLELTEDNLEKDSCLTSISRVDSSLSLWLNGIMRSGRFHHDRSVEWVPDLEVTPPTPVLSSLETEMETSLASTKIDVPEKEDLEYYRRLRGKYPESYHRLHLGQRELDFLGRVQRAPKTTLSQPIRSPAYRPPPPPKPLLLAPGGNEYLPEPQGYVEYLGWMNPTELANIKSSGNYWQTT
ncbi:hypothetical protein F5Y19DRAFT_477339 [Xylariaceae sp. FL1651]|nr:hypothetical protein F5Y19DRAFT_477339 [Xylariaceae sp. FL1651]